MTDSVLVIGGGIAGIQASLDLADRGFQVYLVERDPAIGGRMAQLDKTFPTLDCSICILAPKMAECAFHPNIKILTYSEVKAVDGEAPAFKVKVLRKARYVDEDKCTGCGECMEKCPAKVPSEFEVGMGERKAIYLQYLQAVPRVATVDPENCIKLTKDKCGACLKVCKAEAINFDMKEEELTLDVGAIVVATGFEVWDPSEAKEYGYGICPNVYTSIEYERMISASGPTGGHIKRRSDDKEPKRIAWIQCVGSRNPQHGQPYCCSVCCTISTKQSILAHEHIEDVKTSIFFKDIRTFGKGFYEFKLRAEEVYGTKYVNSDATVEADQATQNPVVVYDVLGKPEKQEVDMVVLAVAMIPRKGTKELADLLGISLDEFGFLGSKDLMLGTLETSKKGIFLAGYCKNPMDIPDSILTASAAAAMSSELLKGGGSSD